LREAQRTALMEKRREVVLVSVLVLLKLAPIALESVDLDVLEVIFRFSSSLKLGVYTTYANATVVVESSKMCCYLHTNVAV
jgi:hypothetical protein